MQLKLTLFNVKSSILNKRPTNVFRWKGREKCPKVAARAIYEQNAEAETNYESWMEMREKD